jgi:hypothetical protein
MSSDLGCGASRHPYSDTLLFSREEEEEDDDDDDDDDGDESSGGVGSEDNEEEKVFVCDNCRRCAAAYNLGRKLTEKVLNIIDSKLAPLRLSFPPLISTTPE